MKKFYTAPVLECLTFLSASPIGSDEDLYVLNEENSSAWNEGELNWT